MSRLMDWLLGRGPLGTVDHWSPDRAQHYARQTYRYLGIRPEPIYPWSRKFRPKAKLTAVKPFKQRSA